jgi:hypothetical protein
MLLKLVWLLCAIFAAGFLAGLFVHIGAQAGIASTAWFPFSLGLFLSFFAFAAVAFASRLALIAEDNHTTFFRVCSRLYVHDLSPIVVRNTPRWVRGLGLAATLYFTAVLVAFGRHAVPGKETVMDKISLLSLFCTLGYLGLLSTLVPYLRPRRP